MPVVCLYVCTSFHLSLSPDFLMLPDWLIAGMFSGRSGAEPAGPTHGTQGYPLLQLGWAHSPEDGHARVTT